MTDAREYGNALFLISEEDGTTERTVVDVRCALELFRQNPDYQRLLDTPAVPKEERTSLIDKALTGLDQNLINLIKILAERHMAHAFPEAGRAYLEKYDTSRGILRAEAVTAVPLTDAQREKLAKNLSAKCGKRVTITNVIDPSILGGVKLRYGGTQLDDSVKTRLEAFEKSLANIVL